MTTCDNCGSERVVHHEQSGQIICRECRYCWTVEGESWYLTGPEYDGWLKLSQHDKSTKGKITLK